MSLGRFNIVPKQCDIALPFPTNWTAMVFFSVLGGLHLAIAFPAFAAGHIEGELSLLLGMLFLSAGLLIRLTRCQLVIRPGARYLCTSTWLGRVWFEHRVTFDRVLAVRVFLAGPAGGDCRVEIVCDREDIECPPTRIPRQEALCLAMTIGVKLIKVYGDGTGQAPARLDSLPHSQGITPDEPGH